MTLVAVPVPNMLGAFEYAKEARDIGDIHTIAGEIQSYEIVHEKFPDSLADIGFDKKLNVRLAAGVFGVAKRALDREAQV
jgi:hypothetical protein